MNVKEAILVMKHQDTADLGALEEACELVAETTGRMTALEATARQTLYIRKLAGQDAWSREDYRVAEKWLDENGYKGSPMWRDYTIKAAWQSAHPGLTRPAVA